MELALIHPHHEYAVWTASDRRISDSKLLAFAKRQALVLPDYAIVHRSELSGAGHSIPTHRLAAIKLAPFDGIPCSPLAAQLLADIHRKLNREKTLRPDVKLTNFALTPDERAVLFGLGEGNMLLGLRALLKPYMPESISSPSDLV